jgi:hypothetical protein
MELNDSRIRKSITNLLAELDLPREVSFNNKNVVKLDQKKNHYSLVFIDKLLVRIVPKKTEYVLEFQAEYEKFFTEITVAPRKWVEIRLKELDEIIGLKHNIRKIFEYELKRTHGDPFGCCSRYLQCSDARKCIHEDFLVSLGCHYRINLLENRIFYGKNMND